MMRRRNVQPPPPWSIHHLPLQLRLLSLILSHYHTQSQPPLTTTSPNWLYPHPMVTNDDVSPSQTMWDLARRPLLLSNNAHPLPSLSRHHTFQALSLNVGGPHLSKKRWNQLLRETTMTEPTLIAYQEVRFKSGCNHLCQVARMVPHYQPIAHTADNPDVLFPVHRSIAQYTRLLKPAHQYGVAIEVSLPDLPALTAANIHGPFDRRSHASLDLSISCLPHFGLLMGDFNHGRESVWPRHRPVRRWHHKLLDGTLIDPPSNTTSDMDSHYRTADVLQGCAPTAGHAHSVARPGGHTQARQPSGGMLVSNTAAPGVRRS